MPRSRRSFRRPVTDPRGLHSSQAPSSGTLHTETAHRLPRVALDLGGVAMARTVSTVRSSSPSVAAARLPPFPREWWLALAPRTTREPTGGGHLSPRAQLDQRRVRATARRAAGHGSFGLLGTYP